MVKVGIYIFTHQIKDRFITDKDRYFDGKAYYGFNQIISEIDLSKYSIEYVSSANFNNVDFVLVSITSFYDIFNIRNDLKNKNKKAKFIFGGAGISNLESLYDIADVIVLGRAEGLINKILNYEPIPNVYYKIYDYNLENKYIIGQANYLIKYNDFQEKTIGCPDKCKFCQFSWKFNLYPQIIDNYNSGYNNREDTINNLDFSLCNRRTAPRLNSAIDGFTEYTRKKIGKKILNSDITKKLREIYDLQNPYFALKLYAIVGFSWENSIEIEEFYNAVQAADKVSDKKLNIFLISTHFVPMPFTPMECEPVNLYDFRSDVEKNNYTRLGKSINIYYPYSQITSPLTAIEQTIVNRIKKEELEKFDKILLTSKYKTLNNNLKVKVIDKYFEGIYDKKNPNEICKNIIRTYNYKHI